MRNFGKNRKRRGSIPQEMDLYVKSASNGTGGQTQQPTYTTEKDEDQASMTSIHGSGFAEIATLTKFTEELTKDSGQAGLGNMGISNNK